MMSHREAGTGIFIDVELLRVDGVLDIRPRNIQVGAPGSKTSTTATGGGTGMVGGPHEHMMP